jgi:hypothetical protein
MQRIIAAFVIVLALLGAHAGAEAVSVFLDVNCGAVPPGGVPTQVQLERATSAAGPFVALAPAPFPLPSSGLVTDATVPAGVATVVYRCKYGNVIGFGGAGPVSDPAQIATLPGTPTDKPVIIIRVQ